LAIAKFLDHREAGDLYNSFNKSDLRSVHEENVILTIL